MDVMMTEKRGYKATEKNRENEKKQGGHMPIVALTASTTSDGRRKCLESGMDDFLSKPVKPDAIMAALEKWVARETHEERELKTEEVEDPCDKEIFDREALLEKMMNDAQVVQQIIDLFLEDTPKRIFTLKNALDNKDGATVGVHAHTIKGAAGNICAEALMKSAFEVEKSGKAGDIEMAAEHYQEISRQFEKLQSVLS